METIPTYAELVNRVNMLEKENSQLKEFNTLLSVAHEYSGSGILIMDTQGKKAQYTNNKVLDLFKCPDTKKNRDIISNILENCDFNVQNSNTRTKKKSPILKAIEKGEKSENIPAKINTNKLTF